MKTAKDYLEHWLSYHSGTIDKEDADELRSIFVMQERGASCAEVPPQENGGCVCHDPATAA